MSSIAWCGMHPESLEKCLTICSISGSEGAVVQAAQQHTPEGSTPQPQAGPSAAQSAAEGAPLEPAATAQAQATPWKTPAPLLAAQPDTPGTALPASGWQSMLADEEADTGKPSLDVCYGWLRGALVLTQVVTSMHMIEPLSDTLT